MIRIKALTALHRKLWSLRCAAIPLAFSLFASTAEAVPPAPAHATPEVLPFLRSDYPLDPGDVWRYSTEETLAVEDGLESRTGFLEIRVLARHRHGPLLLTVLERRRSGPEPGEEITFVAGTDTASWFIADPRRMRAILAGDPAALDPERADLRFPLKPGRRWGVLESGGRPDSRYVTDVGVPESIAVPAGVFECIPLQFTTLPDQSTSWLRPGIGLVQYAYRHHGNRSGETWRLVDFHHGPVDTAAIGRAIDGAFDRLLAQPGFWSRRSSAVWDPTLRALLGPLSGGDGPDLDEGIRRFYIRGDGSSLTIEQLSNVPSWAYLVRWRSDRRVLHVFAREGEPPGGGILGAIPAPPLFLGSVSETPVGQALQKVRADFVRARRVAERGDTRRAGIVADSAMTLAADVLSSALDAAPPGDSAVKLKQAVREAIGDAFLTTHYGRRIRIDDGFVRYRMERGRDRIGVWAHLIGEGGTMYGSAPRVRGRGSDSRTWVLGGGLFSLEPRKILDLDWSMEGSETDVLVWSAGLPPLNPPSITLFRLEEQHARAVWRREVPEGQARLISDRSRLELIYTRQDSLNGVFRTLWREQYDPPGAGSEIPIPVRREILNPWMATASRVVNALRVGRKDMAAPVVRGDDLLRRIAVSWIADPRIRIESVDTDPVSIDRLDGERVASVTLRRGVPRLPENPGPETLAFRLTPDTAGNWVIVDLVALHSSDLLSP